VNTDEFTKPLGSSFFLFEDLLLMSLSIITPYIIEVITMIIFNNVAIILE